MPLSGYDNFSFWKESANGRHVSGSKTCNVPILDGISIGIYRFYEMSPGTVVDLKYRMIDFFVHYFISLYFLVDISYFDAILYLFGIILLLSSNTVCSHFRIAATSLSV